MSTDLLNLFEADGNQGDYGDLAITTDILC